MRNRVVGTECSMSLVTIFGLRSLDRSCVTVKKYYNVQNVFYRVNHLKYKKVEKSSSDK